MVDEGAARRATLRGEQLRAELLAHLRSGPQTAVALLRQVQVADVSLSEVSFQLARLAEEGRVVGERGRAYQVA